MECTTRQQDHHHHLHCRGIQFENCFNCYAIIRVFLSVLLTLPSRVCKTNATRFQRISQSNAQREWASEICCCSFSYSPSCRYISCEIKAKNNVCVARWQLKDNNWDMAWKSRTQKKEKQEKEEVPLDKEPPAKARVIICYKFVKRSPDKGKKDPCSLLLGPGVDSWRRSWDLNTDSKKQKQE